MSVLAAEYIGRFCTVVKMLEKPQQVEYAHKRLREITDEWLQSEEGQFLARLLNAPEKVA